MPDESPLEVRPKELLSLSLVSTESHASRSALSLLASVVIQSLVIAALIIVPLMATDNLPTPSLSSTLVLPPPPAPPRAPSAPPAGQPSPPSATPPVVSSFVIPVEIPDTIAPSFPRDAFVDHGVDRRAPDATTPFVVGGLEQPSPAPPPPPTGPIRVGGNVREPRRTVYVAPIYPAIARQARIQGEVTLEAIIGVSGSVENLRVVSAHPMLAGAALDAVSQWVYEPTLLNGAPVPIVISVNVSFILGGR